MSTGKFINFLIDFKTCSYQEQAKIILEKADTLVKGGSKGVAITYSANYEQTVTIEAVYMAGGWNTKTSGGNQAKVMEHMLSALDGSYPQLQGKMRIAPITTMPGGTIYQLYFSKSDFHRGIVVSDLVRIKAYLDAGWDILGWQNQNTIKHPKDPYAIGGGYAHLPPDIDDLIQNTLIGYHDTYQ